jgi:sulfite reductase (NADPH) hemoprotein beta-component
MTADQPHDTLGSGRVGFAREEDVDLFVSKLEAFESGALSPDDWRAFRLLNGTYGQRQDGVMMIRAKLPGGILTPHAMEALADVAERYTPGKKGHVTTRQNVQFHFIPMAETPDALRRLAEAGITTKEACGNSVRNWTCCPMAGVSKDEPFDVTPYLEALARHLLRGPYSSTLPRKFKPSIGGCCGTDCSQAFINDLGLLARVKDGVHGFEVVAAGGLSTLRRSALVLEEFVPAGEALDVADALVRVFHKIGNRTNKAKARLKWAVDKIGVEAFKAEYFAERAAIRAAGGTPLVLPPQPEPPRYQKGLPQLAPPLDGYEAWAKDSVRPQKQDGFSAVTIRLVLGDASVAQWRALARLAISFGEGEMRATNEQNLLLRYVPSWKLPLLHKELVAIGLAKAGAKTVHDVTSCPGASSCKIAVTASRGLASLLTEALDARPDLVAAAPELDIKISGCPNGCGQHYIGGIGFQGGMRKVAGRAVPQYLVYLGGGITAKGADFGKLVAKVPARRAPLALVKLLELYVAEGQGRGHSFWKTVPADKLKATLGDLVDLADADAKDEDFIDLGETSAFEVVAGEGECAA